MSVFANHVVCEVNKNAGTTTLGPPSRLRRFGATAFGCERSLACRAEARRRRAKVGGEGGIRSGRWSFLQQFRPEFNRQKLQKHSKTGVQVQNKYSELWVGTPPACRRGFSGRQPMNSASATCDAGRSYVDKPLTSGLRSISGSHAKTRSSRTGPFGGRLFRVRW